MSLHHLRGSDSRSRTTLVLADGTSIALAGFMGCLEHVLVPHGSERTGYLRKDQEALVTGVLVAPTAAGFTPSVPDLGTLVFEYNERPRFNAPVSALMNRYHGLTTLAGLKNRVRLLVDPQVGLDDLLDDGVFLGALTDPIHLREGLRYTIRHLLPKAASVPDDTLLVASDALRERGIAVDPAAVALLVKPSALTVELQMLFNPCFADRREVLGLRWDF